MNIVLWLPFLLIISGLIGYILRVAIGKYKLNAAEHIANSLIVKAKDEAEREKKEALFENQKILHEERQKLDHEYQGRQKDLQDFQKRLENREDGLERRFTSMEAQERKVDHMKHSLEEEKEKLNLLTDKRMSELERISGLSKEEARKEIVAEVEHDAKLSAIQLVKKYEEDAIENGKAKARDIILTCIERSAVEITAEKTITTIALPNDEMKGRIIGREGRNIRSFESITGVDLIIDDTPEIVVVSSFDPYRREVAKITLETLINDGRIHPTHIEEVVEKVQENINAEIVEAGKQACLELKINLPREIYPYIGRLKYRTSYGQNVYYHSIEIANIAGMMASMLGANVENCKMAALLHDIGKTIKANGVGGHAVLGADVLRKYGINERVVNAVAAHHQEVENKFIEGHILIVADAMSAARPGARRESFEDYINRLQNLEEIAYKRKGVKKAFAVQAGREIRIFVDSGEVSDNETFLLAKDIAQDIEDNLQYPGQIKITAVRETKVIEYAK